MQKKRKQDGKACGENRLGRYPGRAAGRVAVTAAAAGPGSPGLTAAAAAWTLLPPLVTACIPAVFDSLAASRSRTHAHHFLTRLSRRLIQGENHVSRNHPRHRRR